jgi:hypothetical protein
MHFPSCFPANSHFPKESSINVQKCDLHHNAIVRLGKFAASAMVSRRVLGGVALMLLPLHAQSQTGRIGFAGRLVMPTCVYATRPVSVAFMSEKVSTVSCRSVDGRSIRSYRLSVTPVPADGGDRVLDYFFRYVTGAPGSHPAPALATLQYN